MRTISQPRRRKQRKPARALSTMRQIVDRCFPWSYGKDYVPAIKTTRKEGPTKSRLHRAPMAKSARALQPVSAAEMRVGVWVVYQPSFLEALENRPCMLVPGVPILDGYPLLQGKPLPYSSGTVELAKLLGIKHPMTSDDRPLEQRLAGPVRDFYPLVSDLLALLNDAYGVRAVHLFIKKTPGELELTGRAAELFRLEQAYYAEGEIPTVKICEKELDATVTDNLVRLVKIAHRGIAIPTAMMAEALLYMQERVFFSSPRSWLPFFQRNFGLLHEDVFTIFHYGVFHRHLKVDLTEAVAFDRVHRPERVNYAANFAERFLEPMR